MGERCSSQKISFGKPEERNNLEYLSVEGKVYENTA
jgi:hypothetical protein